MPNHDHLRNDAATVRAETAQIDFKDRFEPAATSDWCEVIKDLLAMANSGGGCILFGLTSTGDFAGIEPCGFASIDPADVANKVSSYLYRQFTGFELASFERGGRLHPTIVVHGVDSPLVPRHNGTYQLPNGRQTSAFYQGIAYFRHGAKSEPGEQADFDRLISRAEDRGLRRIEEIITTLKAAPPGATLQVLPPGVQVSMPSTHDRVRLSADASAPQAVLLDHDGAYPYRSSELVAKLNERLGRLIVNSHDVLCVRRAHGIDLRRKEMLGKLKFGPLQFSPLFLDFMADEFSKDPEFFQKARKKYRELQLRE